MKEKIKRAAKVIPGIYPFGSRIYHFFRALKYLRIIKLSPNRLSENRFEALVKNPEYEGIFDDLLDYTGLSYKELKKRLLREPITNFESEFRWRNPETERELSWFYRCSEGYFFGNAAHGYWSLLDEIQEGRVLDYGAGVGSCTIRLAKKGLYVDFVEIGRIQADFINFRAKKHSLSNVHEILPYNKNRFDPIEVIKQTYDAIITRDVLEHIPNYHLVVQHLINHLNTGGIIFENSPFSENSSEIDIHLKASIPLEEAMKGMQKIKEGVWRKII